MICPGEIVQCLEGMATLYSAVGTHHSIVDVGRLNASELGLTLASYHEPRGFIAQDEILVLTSSGVVGWTYIDQFVRVHRA